MSTPSTYIAIENNLANYQKLTANEPAAKTATADYKANIGKVTTISQFVGNYRLLSFALQAYGLGNQINNTALIKQVLQQCATSSKALANTLPNASWKAFANAYNFSATGTAAPSASGSVTTAVADYNEQQLESDQGATDPGVQLALYFKRVAPTVTNSYSILADQNLLARPGVTGWAQVNGGTLLTPEEKNAMDAWCIRHASLRFDLQVAWQTPRDFRRGQVRNARAIRRAVRWRTKAEYLNSILFSGYGNLTPPTDPSGSSPDPGGAERTPA